MDPIITELHAIRNQIKQIGLRQQHDSEILRKTANSINVIVRLMAGVLHKSTNELSAILVKAEGLLHVVKPYENSNFESMNLNTNEYPIHHFRSMLLDLVNIIDIGQSGKRSDSLSPIHTPSRSEASISTNVTQNTYYGAQNNNIIPNASHPQTNFDKPTAIVYERLMSPDITMNTYLRKKDKIIPSVSSVQKNIDKPTTTIPETSETQISPDITQNIYCRISNKNTTTPSVPLVQTNIDKPTTMSKAKAHIPLDVTQNSYSNKNKNIQSLPVVQQMYDKATDTIPKTQISTTQNKYSSVHNDDLIIPGVSLEQTNITTTNSETQTASDFIPNYINKPKVDEEACALRRWYRNKYRYLNVRKNAEITENTVSNITETPINNVVEKPTSNDLSTRTLFVPKEDELNTDKLNVKLDKFPIKIIPQKIKKETKKLATSTSEKRKLKGEKKIGTLSEKEKASPQKNNKKAEIISEKALRRATIKQINFEPNAKKKKNRQQITDTLHTGSLHTYIYVFLNVKIPLCK